MSTSPSKILTRNPDTEGFFGFHTFGMKFCDILKYGNNLKLEIIDYIFRKIIKLNEVSKQPQRILSKTSLEKWPEKTLSRLMIQFYLIYLQYITGFFTVNSPLVDSSVSDRWRHVFVGGAPIGPAA